MCFPNRSSALRIAPLPKGWNPFTAIMKRGCLCPTGDQYFVPFLVERSCDDEFFCWNSKSLLPKIGRYKRHDPPEPVGSLTDTSWRSGVDAIALPILADLLWRCNCQGSR